MPLCMASDKRRDSAEYWESRLVRMGLSAEAGRHTWLAYGHTVTGLDVDGRKTYSAGEIEGQQEWPISLA